MPQSSPAAAHAASSWSRSSRRADRRVGLLIVALAFAASLAISLWAKRVSRPEPSKPPTPPRTEGIAGFPKAVDPVKTLEIARALTNRPLLRGIVADGVRSDGSVDVSEGPGQVRYAFQSAMGEGALPLHEPGTLPRRQFCGKQDVELRRDGLAAEPDAPEHMCSAQEVDALPEPRCDLKRVWAHALEKGAPRDQLARIEYYRSKVGPAWRFELRSGEQRFSLYGDCGRELSAGEADGFVP